MQNLSGFHSCVDSYSASKLDFSLFSRDLGLGDQTVEILNKNFCSKKFSQWWFSESRVTRCNGKAICFSAWVSLLHFYWETLQLFWQHFVVHNCASYFIAALLLIKTPNDPKTYWTHKLYMCQFYQRPQNVNFSFISPKNLQTDKQTNKQQTNEQTNKHPSKQTPPLITRTNKNIEWLDIGLCNNSLHRKKDDNKQKIFFINYSELVVIFYCFIFVTLPCILYWALKCFYFHLYIFF